MNDIHKLVQLLSDALQHPERRAATLIQFRKNLSSHGESGVAWEILRDFAWDSSYYEPDPILRHEDPVYYDDERLEIELQSVIRQLKMVNGM